MEDNCSNDVLTGGLRSVASVNTSKIITSLQMRSFHNHGRSIRFVECKTINKVYVVEMFYCRPLCAKKLDHMSKGNK